MNEHEAQMRRRLPSFQEWLETHSPDTKAPDFEAFADLARRTQTASLDDLPRSQLIFLRMWQGACVAAVELCNMEALKHDTPTHDIVVMLPRVFAAASMYAFASITKEGSPYCSIARIMSEEFSFAAKTSADQLTEQEARS
jgi:hypothetical protein